MTPNWFETWMPLGFWNGPTVLSMMYDPRWSGDASAPGSSLFLFVGAQRRFSLVSFAVVVPKRS
jgi:hypothetical protein